MSWKKFTAFNSSPTSQTYPELPENITYLRLFLGLAYGISLAFRENIPTTTLNGSIGLIFGLNVVTFIPIIYMNFYLNVDTDTFQGVNFAGVVNGMALMILIWVVFFTMLHEDEEKLFTDALVKAVMNGTLNSGDSGTGVTVDDGSDNGNFVEDSEF
mmetsp:Transcript_10683/g.13508  ORF Transcript_10683/g.13508 Transcript_10683/m.13508 type:complete len:157 (-) Transcript_10683:139-609(-)|eukprot:CAMPEP_0203633414 /NCGR_PEP_ID=MMETSP0088-20131115/526_1 /ASSEMBLY_ACC=CAM_ASM_001087 /TAXON_ID=426623 /ORGANISM="Chaetoceros affinis, Strain CCMP159" /LENGTH=156 /DNA_ID=CAMNT_0050486719 /DNA_START=146 /DNA_END=616 /DNA_ORIENTATION=-